MQPPGGKRSYEELAVDILHRLQAGGVLTDVNPGSVVRTLVEAFARQLALAYEQLALIYELGFIDTATGDALDHLVMLLGQQRYTGQQAVGEVTLRRDPRVAGQVTIPGATALQVILARLPDKPLLYKTRRDAVLAAGQSAVTTEIYAELPVGAPPESVLLQAGDVPANVTPAAQLAGVGAAVINRPTSVRGQSESDDDLRARVKGLIVAAGGGTSKALEQAALSTGLAKAVTFRDAQDDPPAGDYRLLPGELEVMADTSAAQHADLRQALTGAKGPGIYVRLREIERAQVALAVSLKLAGSPGPQQRDTLYRTAEQTIRQAIEALQPGDKLRWNPLMAALLHIEGVADVDSATLTASSTTGSETVVLVSQSVTVNAEYPPASASFNKYTRLVPAENRRPVTVHLSGEQVIYVGIRFDSLPKALLGQLKMKDASRLAGALEDRLEQHLLELNKTNARQLSPAKLQAAVYAEFGSYFTDPSVLRITYRDVQSGAQAELQAGNPAASPAKAPDPPVSFAAAQVLLPSPDGVIVTAWGS